MSSLMRGTIESDDEVSVEELDDDANNEKDNEDEDMELDEWEGDGAIGKDDGADAEEKSSQAEEEADNNDDDDEDDGDNDDMGEDACDNVRAMPHSEERQSRAGDKHRRLANLADEVESAKQQAFFSTVIESSSDALAASDSIIFAQLNLSRSLLRAVEAAGYSAPTPVQAKVIPLALEGRDICASAVTGSGKTAAFALPFLERLLYRPKEQGAIRVLVVAPTRELATQIFTVMLRLSMFTDITTALICGGKKDLRSQEATLRNRPDVVVGTPGRVLDHLRNSASVSLDDLEVLVLDEADRLLEMGFEDELNELIRYCPEARQTMLFSATMTPRVDELAKLSLRRPVRVKTSGGPVTVAPRLIQEFVKVRRPADREALVVSLVVRSFRSRCIVFCETKSEARRLTTLLQLLAVRVSELHGDVAQADRDSSLQRFRAGLSDVLVATDVAARGLDIPAVLTVINAEMPRSASTYVHRVGRTARAGCAGRSVTLVSDGRRTVMKAVLKGGGEGAPLQGQVLSRTVPPDVVEEFVARIAGLEEAVRDAAREDKSRRAVEAAERELERAENLMLHADEISSRPARSWHQTETQKRVVQEAVKGALKIEGLEKEGPKTEGGVRGGSVEARALSMARRDEYGPSDAAEKKHGMSRLKRRRLEALSASEEGARGDPGMGESKRAKSGLRRVEEEARVRGREGVLGETKKKGKPAGKIRRPRVALGGLDAEVYGGLDPFRGRKSSRPKETLADLKDFDPLKKLRKGGKPSKNAFKSKGKYKRR